MAIAAAGPDRVALITDAMLAAGASDGRYRLGTLPVDVSDGRARVVEADGSAGAIAGSTLTMAAAYERLVGLGLPHDRWRGWRRPPRPGCTGWIRSGRSRPVGPPTSVSSMIAAFCSG